MAEKDQAAFWKNQVLSGKVLGAYAQTELGHGSNVQMLETKAIYQKDTKNFIINTPTTTSVKYWPGVLGTFATHCVVQARTFVEDKDIGVQTFVIEIRNE